MKTITVSQMFDRLYGDTLRQAPALQRRETRKAFFSGAWEVLERMLAIAATEGEHEAAQIFLGWGNEIQRELRLYGCEFGERPNEDAKKP